MEETLMKTKTKVKIIVAVIGAVAIIFVAIIQKEPEKDRGEVSSSITINNQIYNTLTSETTSVSDNGSSNSPVQKNIQLEEGRNDPPPVVAVASEEKKSNPPVQPSPKIENITLTVTTTETASEFAFGGDVKITLEKVIDLYDQVFGNITVYSPRESQSFELKKFELQKIGRYEISVEETGHDYAEFRIVRR
jgi:hypothetical protein